MNTPLHRYAGFEEAYRDHLAALLHEPAYRNAPRGFGSRERVGVSFTVADPRRRLVHHPVRRSNLVFNLAEVLWYLSGRDDLSYLAYYAPRVARYSADGVRLTGTAYGPRIRRFGIDRIDQWDSVASVLAEDPDSKRAVVQIYQPEELLLPGNLDVACTLALQFLLRDGRLHAVGYMRANDVFRGMVSDVFSFTVLQEAMACRLGVDVGEYTHMVGSLHLYDPDEPAARRLLAADPQPPGPAMPPLPVGDCRPAVAKVMAWEERLRHNSVRLTDVNLDGLGLDPYWQHVLTVFELYRRVRHGEPTDPGLLGRLPTGYRALLAHRFPQLLDSPENSRV